MAAAVTTGQRAANERAELLARAVSDFETFCRVLIRIAPEKGDSRIPLIWNPIQRRYSEARTRRDIILKSRRVGMTTLELARDVWRFLRRNENVLVVCQTDKNSTYLKDFSRTVERMFEGLRTAGLALPFGVDSVGLWTMPSRDSTLQIVEAGASQAAASKKARGAKLSRVHSTEAAFYEFAEHTFNAMLEGVPLTGDSEIVFESTPNGAAGWFFEQWNAAVSGAIPYTPHFFAWFDDPRDATPLLPGEVIEPETERERELVDVHGVSLEQLKWYRGKLAEKNGNQDIVDQEYPSDSIRCFLSSGRKFFDGAALDVMAGRKVQPIRIDGNLRVWHELPRGERAVIGVDPAEGIGVKGDHTVAMAWSKRSRLHLGTLRSQLRATPFAAELVRWARELNDALIIIERNKGMALIEAVEALKYPNVYYDDTGKPGFATTLSSRPIILEDLAQAIRSGAATSSDDTFINEARGFVIDARTGRPHAPTKGQAKGTSDDTIFAAALAWRVMLEGRSMDYDAKAATGGQRFFNGGDANGGGGGMMW